jgi:hypothetical protein
LLSFELTSNPSHGTISGTPPLLIYTPNAGYDGPDSFNFSASDGLASPAEALISLTIVNLEPPPLPNIRAERIETGCRITLNASAAGTYRLEWSEDLTEWHQVEERVLTEAGEIEIIDNTASVGQRFYRASARR